jgi:DNA-binding XRE family transcriptional regulator
MKENNLTNLELIITRNVIKARDRADIPRKEAAKELGLDENSYGHYERGRYAFTIDQLSLLARLFHAPMEELLGLPLVGDMTEEQRWLLNAWRELSDDERYSVRVLIKAYLDKPTP